MEIIKGLNISTSDFWYDVTDGGYLKPKEILAKTEDVEAVGRAIKVLRDFQDSCEAQIEDFYQ